MEFEWLDCGGFRFWAVDWVEGVETGMGKSVEGKGWSGNGLGNVVIGVEGVEFGGVCALQEMVKIDI